MKFIAQIQTGRHHWGKRDSNRPLVAALWMSSSVRIGLPPPPIPSLAVVTPQQTSLLSLVPNIGNIKAQFVAWGDFPGSDSWCCPFVSVGPGIGANARPTSGRTLCLWNKCTVAASSIFFRLNHLFTCKTQVNMKHRSKSCTRMHKCIHARHHQAGSLWSSSYHITNKNFETTEQTF